MLESRVKSRRVADKAAVALLVALAASAARAQDAPKAPPAFLEADGKTPDPEFLQTVLKDVASLPRTQRQEYLDELRRTRMKIEGAIRNRRESVRALKNDIARKERGLAAQAGEPRARAEEGLANQRAAVAKLSSEIETLLSASRALFSLIDREDPTELHVDTYAAAVFSNLYRTNGESGGYFSSSKPFLEIETRQILASRTGSNPFLLWGRIGLQTGAFQGEQASSLSQDPVRSFWTEAGLEWKPPVLPDSSSRLRVSAIVGAGVAGFDSQAEADDLSGQSADEFRFRGRAGVLLRTESGQWEGTLAEASYFHDPTFAAANRFLLRGRLLFAPRTNEGRALGAYLEGSVNVGGGRDEVRMTIGLRVDTLAVFSALIGGGSGSASTAD